MLTPDSTIVFLEQVRYLEFGQRKSAAKTASSALIGTGDEKLGNECGMWTRRKKAKSLSANSGASKECGWNVAVELGDVELGKLRRYLNTTVVSTGCLDCEATNNMLGTSTRSRAWAAPVPDTVHISENAGCAAHYCAHYWLRLLTMKEVVKREPFIENTIITTSRQSSFSSRVTWTHAEPGGNPRYRSIVLVDAHEATADDTFHHFE